VTGCYLKDCDDEAATGRRALRFTLQQLLKNPDDSLLDTLRKLFSSKCPGWFVAITRCQAAFLVMAVQQQRISTVKMSNLLNAAVSTGGILRSSARLNESLWCIVVFDGGKGAECHHHACDTMMPTKMDGDLREAWWDVL
jgi:hypothetical protein